MLSPGASTTPTADALARFIVFLESKERPGDAVAFIRGAFEASAAGQSKVAFPLLPSSCCP